MKTSQLGFPALVYIILCAWILVCTSCATAKHEVSPENASVDAPTKQERPGASFGIPGFEGLGSPTARRKQDVLAKFGPPTSEEKAGTQMQYEFLAYPVRGWEEKLLLLFYSDELLGFCRESSRGALDSTVQHHQRIQGGRTILYQSWFNGQTSYFVTSREHLEKAPKWKWTDRGNPPLSEKQAERLAAEWLQRSAPNSSGEPKSRELMEVKDIPGAAFYVVNLGVFNPAPNLFEVVVLMDGTVLPGELDVTPK